MPASSGLLPHSSTLMPFLLLTTCRLPWPPPLFASPGEPPGPPGSVGPVHQGQPPRGRHLRRALPPWLQGHLLHPGESGTAQPPAGSPASAPRSHTPPPPLACPQPPSPLPPSLSRYVRFRALAFGRAWCCRPRETRTSWRRARPSALWPRACFTATSPRPSGTPPSATLRWGPLSAAAAAAQLAPLLHTKAPP